MVKFLNDANCSQRLHNKADVILRWIYTFLNEGVLTFT